MRPPSLARIFHELRRDPSQSQQKAREKSGPEAGGGAVALLAAVVLLPSCQLRAGGDAESEEPARVAEASSRRVFLGNVTLVNDNSQFVLIKTPVLLRLKPGMPLQSFHDGELSSELLFSPEQSFGFMTADISEGAPMVGDSVFLRHTEDFENQASPRMQQAMEQFEREQNMGFFERRKYQRTKKRAAKKKKRAPAEQ